MVQKQAYKTSFLSLLLVGLLMIFPFTACNETTDKKEMEVDSSVAQTITGEILDLSCFLVDGRRGMGHHSCAQGCLDRGLPAGLITEDGKVYLLLEDHQKPNAYHKLIKHAAEVVELTGKVFYTNGMLSMSVEDMKLQG